jgi:hypothetical protein
MKHSKDKKSLNEKMLCFVTSIPHVGNNNITKENGSTMRPGKDKLIDIRAR